MTPVEPLSLEQLYQHTDPDQFSFETTAELDAIDQVIGQKRAIEAVQFGVGIHQKGYNMYALGPHGLGKYEAIHDIIEEKAAGEPVPADWVYVHNFDQEHKPEAMSLPAGRGLELCEDMRKLVEELQAVIPAAFETEEYHAQRQAVEEELRERQEQAFEELKERAQEKEIALVQTPNGLAFAPMREGEVVPPKDFLSLPDDEQKRVQSEVEELQEELQRIMRQMPQWQKEIRERLKELQREVATFTVEPLFEELKEKYEDLEEVLAYLEAVQNHIIDNVDNFLQQQQQEDGNPLAMMMRGRRPQAQPPSFTEYEVNLLVDNGETDGAPVVHLELPTYQNLIGRIEHMSQMGALITNFTLIKPGALHQANGGYLLLDARKLLLQPYAWEGLKRALRTQDVTIESLGQMYSLISTVSLEPEPIPLNVKVILLGERLLYYLLYQYDPEFGELFKVMVDFEDEMERNSDNDETYARLIASMAKQDDLLPFDRGAVARVIEYGARVVSDKERLTTHMQSISDLLQEANHWSKEADREIVQQADVQQAIEAMIYRASRIKERSQEVILRETVLIDTTGEVEGQINGLAVLQVGNYAFGRPSRITATVRMGKGEVIDIERRAELGGPIHSKGVLILSSFLSSRYSEERPFALNASLVFEQSYSGVEGDSASSAELYALLSVMAEVPIRQGLAVTGSVNQRGQVQAIGGVNQKIEGFFDICKQRGLTGDQGVLIPRSNVKNLMLRREVREAVEAGEFHIYPIEHVDQGIELLTGVPAGELDEEGNYPEGTINRLIVDRLETIAKTQRRYGRPSRDGESAEADEGDAEENGDEVPDEIPDPIPISDGEEDAENDG